MGKEKATPLRLNLSENEERIKKLLLVGKEYFYGNVRTGYGRNSKFNKIFLDIGFLIYHNIYRRRR